jgi:hypothetical protein
VAELSGRAKPHKFAITQPTRELIQEYNKLRIAETNRQRGNNMSWDETVSHSVSPYTKYFVDRIMSDEDMSPEAKRNVKEVLNDFVRDKIRRGEISKDDLSPTALVNLYPEDFVNVQRSPEPPERKKSRFELVDMV